MYFNNLPIIYYEYDINGQRVLKTVKDVTANVRFRKAILENITLFDEYDMQPGDTPNIIAAKYYGASEYHWVVMLCNQKYDWTEDFPRDYYELEQHIYEKYANPQAVHHYENADGFVVDSTTPGAMAVTNYQYEERVNESKRRIKLISPDLLAGIIAEFKKLLV